MIPSCFLFVYFVVIQLKHPSALDTFNQMMSIARGKKIVVCLDYDGTLSNIVDNPEKAFMTNKVNITVIPHENIVLVVLDVSFLHGLC